MEREDGVFTTFDQDNKAYKFNVYPLDFSRRKPPYKLATLTSECLKHQLEQRGHTTRPRSLLGSCHKNARNLFDYLCSQGYNPSLIIGCNLSAGEASGVEDSFKSVKNAHQWVEVGSYIVEICSEANNSVGKLYISSNRPSNYKSYITLSENLVRSYPSRYVTSDNITDIIELSED